jgi:hypothetical protein
MLARADTVFLSVPSRFAIFSVMSASDEGGIAVEGEGVGDDELELELAKIWTEEVERKNEVDVEGGSEVGIEGEVDVESEQQRGGGVYGEGPGGAPMGW